MNNRRIAVIVPSSTNTNQAASPETVGKWVKRAKTEFAELFGGFTSHSAQGGWLSPLHGLVEENVVVVASFTDDHGLNRLNEVKKFASKMARALSQEAVAVEVDHALHFIEPQFVPSSGVAVAA